MPTTKRLVPCWAIVVALCVSALNWSQSASAAPSWLAATKLAEGPISKYPGVSVAMDAKGDTLAVWCQLVGANEAVESAWRPAGGSFGAPVGVSPIGDYAINPTVAMNAEGNATVAWIQHAHTAYEGQGDVEAASRLANGTFSQPVELENNDEAEGFPLVAVDAEGNATVAWLRHDAGDFNHVEVASLYANGQSEQGVLLLPSSSRRLTTTAPALTANASGAAVVAWGVVEAEDTGQPLSSSYTLEASTRPTTQAPFGSSFELGATSESTPAIALDDAGEANLAWADSGLVSTAPLASNETLGAPTLLSNLTARGEEGIIDSAPSIATDAAGESIVAWLSGTQPVATVLGGRAFELADAAADANPPKLAMNDRGDSIAMWVGRGGDHEGVAVVEAATRSAGERFGAPAALSTGSEATTAPQIALDAQGDGVGAWTSTQGSRESIEVAGYQAAGPALEAIEIPSEGRVDEALAFSVTALSVWSTVASTRWSWGDGTPDSEDAIATHTFTAPGDHQVTLSVTDALGNVATVTRTVSIRAASGPAADEQATATQSRPVTTAHKRSVHLHPTVAKFTPLFATRAASGGKLLGLLVEIVAVRGASAGSRLVVRCVAGCQQTLRKATRVTHRSAREGIRFPQPFALDPSTRIEIDDQAPHRIGRFVRYRFVRTQLGVIAHVTREGCLSADGRAQRCSRS